MRTEGSVLICDRCGAMTVALKNGEEFISIDHAYNEIVNTYEEPQGWWFGCLYNSQLVNLCPKCTEEYKKLLLDFAPNININYQEECRSVKT